MNDKDLFGGLPDSTENPAFPDITSDLDSGYSSDPLGSSGSSFPDIGTDFNSSFDSGFSSDPLGSSGLDDFPEISTDDFASIQVDETVSVDDLPDTPEPDTPASAFPDVTKPAHDNGIPDPVPPPPVIVPDPVVMPSVDPEKPSIDLKKPAKPSVPLQNSAQPAEDEEDYAGDHYVWNGREYVQTDAPSDDYTSAGTKAVPPTQTPQYEGKLPKTNGSAPNQGRIYMPFEPIGQSAKTVRNCGIASIIVSIVSCFGCSPIAVILAIVALIKGLGLNKNKNELNMQEQTCVKTGITTSIITLVITIPFAIVEILGFLIAIFAPE